MQTTESFESEVRLANALFGKKPRPLLKNNILQTLENLASEQHFDLSNPPLINEFSEPKIWEKAVRNIIPPAGYKDMYYHLLIEDDTRITCVVWVRNVVPEEEHDYYKESFLILEGTCDFRANGITKKHGAGDYLTVPDVPHEVKVTSSEPLKFIVQRLKVAA